MPSGQPAFPVAVAAAVREQLPSVAEDTVAAIVVEVPSYADAFSGEMGSTITNAVELALRGFLELATAAGGVDPSTPIRPAIEAAYRLGRGEARSGRPMDALLAAYRIGARVAWREMSSTAVDAGLGGPSIARFAELVFAYIDQLSASSVAGHADELAETGRARERHRERLARRLLVGAARGEIIAAAEEAGWSPPGSLTAVVVPEASAPGALALLDARTLQAPEEASGADGGAARVVLLVPDAGGPARDALLRALEGRAAVIGPPRPWTQARSSYLRAVRAITLGMAGDGRAPVDTESRLAELVLRADDEALTDLRARVLAPLDRLPRGTRAKLVETLRSWLLHQGRRERVAAELFVHPQTVRYRMGQLRELYGAGLDDPRTVFELTVALGAGR